MEIRYVDVADIQFRGCATAIFHKRYELIIIGTKLYSYLQSEEELEYAEKIKHTYGIQFITDKNISDI